MPFLDLRIHSERGLAFPYFLAGSYVVSRVCWCRRAGAWSSAMLVRERVTATDPFTRMYLPAPKQVGVSRLGTQHAQVALVRWAIARYRHSHHVQQMMVIRTHH